MKKEKIKFETLHKSLNFKKIFIGLVVIVAIGSVIILKGSKANYTYEEVIPFAEGEVHIKKYDFKIMAMYKKDSGDYEEINRMPQGNYVINEEKSGCYKDSNKQEKDTEAILKTIDGNHTIANLLKEDKCYLYFDKKEYNCAGPACETIMTNKKIETRTDFSTTLSGDKTGTIYKSANSSQYDDFNKEVYYYAGNPTDNWVKFGKVGSDDIYWRIIRINGDSSIRMIFSGVGSPQTSGDNTNAILKQGFGPIRGSSSCAGSQGSSGTYCYNDNKFVGYMFNGTISQSSTESQYHVRTTITSSSTNSNAKDQIDKWYESTNLVNLQNTYIDGNAGFCGDRTSTTTEGGAPNNTGGIGKEITYYGGKYRLETNKMPTYRCANSNDLYTTSNATQGNKALKYPVGMISADEVVFAGGLFTSNSNQDFYLYTGKYYWTMTPSLFNGSPASIMCMHQTGVLSNYSVAMSSYGFRPVINLKSTVTLSGSGTTTSPYTVS